MTKYSIKVLGFDIWVKLNNIYINIIIPEGITLRCEQLISQDNSWHLHIKFKGRWQLDRQFIFPECYPWYHSVFIEFNPVLHKLQWNLSFYNNLNIVKGWKSRSISWYLKTMTDILSI